MSLTPEDLDAVCKLVDDLCGIYLDEKKTYLIEARLADLLPRHNCETYADLARKARGPAAGAVAEDVIDAITTNETLWFRDTSPFDALRYKLLPELIDAKAGSVNPRRLRMWSAACSTGQEAYSMGMTFADIVPDFQNWDLQILGSDVSNDAVNHARKGVYGDLEISRGLEQEHLGAYFQRSNEQWQVCDALRKKCRFEQRNLLKPFTDAGKFDIIFCRNVAIYFQPEERDDLFRRLGEQLNPGGWLITGSSESLVDLGKEWLPVRHCRATCYQPKPSPHAPVIAR